VHTAGGISIRFPRVTKIRDDKDWRTATDLPRLQQLMRTSQEKADQAIQQLMIKEGGGKLTVPKSVEAPKQTKLTQKRPASSIASSENDSPKKKTRLDSKGNTNTSLSVSSFQTNTTTSRNSFSLDSLPNVFKGDKIFVSSKISEKDVLSRYVVAYGGDLVDDKKLADVIVLNKAISDKLGRIVTKQLIIDKINQ
jgi:DNA ligase-3